MDLIDRQAAIDALNGIINRFEQILRDIRESKVDDSVCGMCEYDGAFVGQSGDWCNECPGFEKDDCFKLSDDCRKRWLKEANLPSAQPEREKGIWINKGRIVRCNKCKIGYATVKGMKSALTYNFCPNCGADMRGEQDDESRSKSNAQTDTRARGMGTTDKSSGI